MTKDKEDITSLRVKKPTRARLEGLGGKADTYDDIINRLIDFYLSGVKKGEFKAIAGKKEA